MIFVWELNSKTINITQTQQKKITERTEKLIKRELDTKSKI